MLTPIKTLLHRFKDLKEPDDVTTPCTTSETTALPAILTTDIALPDERKFEVSCMLNPFVSLLRDARVRVYLNFIAIF